MSTVSVNARGAITFWVCSPTPIANLRGVLDALGYNVVPKQSPVSALRSAEREVSGGSKNRAIFSRKKPAKNGVEVHKVQRGSEFVDVTLDHGSRVTADGQVIVDYKEGQNPSLAEALQAAFETAMATATPGMVGAILTGIVRELGGTKSLGPKVHWIPPSAIDVWQDIATEFRKAGAEVVVVAHDFDRTIGELVVKQFHEEVTKELQRIVGDIDEKQLSDSQLEVRAKKAETILEQIEEYAKALDANLDDLKRAAQFAKTAAVRAAVGSMPMFAPLLPVG